MSIKPFEIVCVLNHVDVALFICEVLVLCVNFLELCLYYLDSCDVFFVSWCQTNLQEHPEYEIQQDIKHKHADPKDFREEPKQAPVLGSDI